ncbi:hypothetical protein [Pseudomonas canadensis]|uniref:hypothetical protein n=1 Tax=Pseudomonas canadensis TaxID=915099 RepID=UPI00040DA905|nr:hypothetical protein [Pseudomonas canadensis]
MSNVSNKQFLPMNTHYAQLNQPSVQADKSLELSPSMDSMNKFLKDSGPAPKENSGPMNKESLEKLFTMFEFMVKAMRSMLAGMGVLPRQPGELDAQPQVKPGLDTKTTVLPGTDAKVIPDAKAEQKVAPGADTKTTVLPGTDAKVIPDAKAEQKVAPGADTKKTVLPGTDAKVVPDAKAEHKVAPEADTKTLVKPGSEVKVMPDGRTQMTTSPDGKLDAQPARPSLIPEDYKNKLSSDVNVTVQVQNCHCPHTGEKVTPQPPVTPGLDTKPSPQPPLMPALDKQPSPQLPVSPGLDTNPSPQPPVTPSIPDLTCPAPDDLVDDFSCHSQTRFDNHRANRPSLRSRF